VKYVVRTLGCKANLSDSQRLEESLQAQGLVPFSEGGEAEVQVCVVNSCTVTDEADIQSRKMARKLKKQYPNAKIVMTGCGAEVSPHLMAESAGVDFVVGNQNKDRFASTVMTAIRDQVASGSVLGSVTGYSELLSRHPMDREWPQAESTYLPPPLDMEGESSRTRLFLKIQEGCNAFCTYCVIPYGRGPSRSVRPRLLIESIRKMHNGGAQEVILTGTNIGDYGSDWSEDGRPCFEDLVQMILDETEIPRLRLSSLDPSEISPRLLGQMRDYSRLMPHFHVSLQSPVTRVLKAMKRKYTQKEVVDCLTAIRGLKEFRGPIFIGMDVITGFPGETDAEFQESVEVLRSLPWSRLHVFPYSEREGTPATRIPGSVPVSVRKERARILSELSFERIQSVYFSQKDGVARGVLLEGSVRGPDGTRDWISGYSQNYLRVLVRANEGAFLKMNRINDLRPDSMALDRPGGEAFYIAKV